MLLVGFLVSRYQQSVIEWGVRWGLEKVLPDAGFELLSVEVEGGIGRPVSLKNLEITAYSRLGGDSRTHLKVAKLEVAFIPLRNLVMGPRNRLLQRLTIVDASGILDYRSEHQPDMGSMRSQSQEEQIQARDTLLRFLPLEIDVAISELLILADGQSYAFSGLELNLQEGRTSLVSLRETEILAGDFEGKVEDATARTIWKDGVAYFVGVDLVEGMTLREFRFDPVRLGGIGMELEADIFSGWARADVFFGEKSGRVHLDATVWAGDIPLQPLPGLLGRELEASGKLVQGRFSFRGFPEEPTQAEVALRLEARKVAWKDRGWDDLVLGLQLRNRTVLLSEFSLEQKENRIRAEGEVSWPEDGNWRKARGHGSLEAELPDVSALADLAGPFLKDTGGSLEVSASVEAAEGSLAGELKAEGSDLLWKGQELGKVELLASLQEGDLSIAKLEWRHADDSLEGNGRVALAPPHLYEGSLQMEVANVAPYQELLEVEPEFGQVSGGLKVHWQGDGTAATHSGGFEVEVHSLQTPQFPEGVNGSFGGTYSPDNFYFRHFALSRDPFHLQWTLSAGKGGVYAENILLKKGQVPLLNGEIYLPWDPRSLLRGGEWTEGILPQRNIYADLRSGTLKLEEVFLLLGQEPVITGSGSFRLQGSGDLRAPQLDASLEVNNLHSSRGGEVPLASRAAVKFASREGRATVEGEVEVPRFDPVLVDLAFPFGFLSTEEGLVWQDPGGELAGKVRLPRVELSHFRALLPEVRALEGVVEGEIKLGNSLFAPTIDGRLELSGGRLEIARNLPDFTDLHVLLRFDGDSFRLEKAGGALGAGPFSIFGEGSFADLANPSASFQIAGEKILLARDRRVRLRADLNLTVAGDLASGGDIRGSVKLVDGRIFQRLEITPLLQAAGTETTAPLLLPDLSGLVLPPWDDWKLDVEIQNASPFLLVGNVASGEIKPDFRFVGTLGDPRMVGEIHLSDLRAYLPFSVVRVDEGVVYLQEDSPRSPVLDIRGSSEILEYNIQLLAYGPLNEKNLILRSEPPLSEEAIFLLLTTGLAPGTTSGAGFGEAAVGQGGILLLKTLARHFEPDGVDLDSLINRVQVTTTPAPVPGLRPTLRGEFRLTDEVSIMSERDGFGFLRGGVTYTLRFK